MIPSVYSVSEGLLGFSVPRLKGHTQGCWRSSVSQVFEAMVAWIKHDKPARLEHMPRLMEHVRLPLLSRDYLVQVKFRSHHEQPRVFLITVPGVYWALKCLQIVEEEALIKNNNTCKDFLIEALKYHLLPADQRHLIKTDRTRPRTPISIPKVPEPARARRCATPPRVFFVTGDCARVQVMVVVGGQAPKAIRSVECYDFQEDRWYQVADLPSRRCRAGRPRAGASAPLIRSGVLR